MRVVLFGGSGQIGTILARSLSQQGHEVLVVSRTVHGASGPLPWRTLTWDACTLDQSWTSAIEGVDAVINLCGRTVNCRYTPKNRRAIIDSRVIPTRLVGRAIAAAHDPPNTWMNASTSTIYRHALDRAQDERTGEYGRRTGGPPTAEQAGLPETWGFSIDVAEQWESTFHETSTPKTRKIALRSSMVMSPDAGGVFSVISGLVRAGLGGTEGSGAQYVSWMHDEDFARAIDLLLAHPEIAEETGGVVNMTAPVPLPNREFMRELRHAWGARVGLPATEWMLEAGALVLRTETELILKSRRVVPGVLLQHGFAFRFPGWAEAAEDLVSRMRAGR